MLRRYIEIVQVLILLSLLLLLLHLMSGQYDVPQNALVMLLDTIQLAASDEVNFPH